MGACFSKGGGAASSPRTAAARAAKNPAAAAKTAADAAAKTAVDAGKTGADAAKTVADAGAGAAKAGVDAGKAGADAGKAGADAAADAVKAAAGGDAKGTATEEEAAEKVEEMAGEVGGEKVGENAEEVKEEETEAASAGEKKDEAKTDEVVDAAAEQKEGEKLEDGVAAAAAEEEGEEKTGESAGAEAGADAVEPVPEVESLSSEDSATAVGEDAGNAVKDEPEAAEKDNDKDEEDDNLDDEFPTSLGPELEHRRSSVRETADAFEKLSKADPNAVAREVSPDQLKSLPSTGIADKLTTLESTPSRSLPMPDPKEAEAAAAAAASAMGGRSLEKDFEKEAKAEDATAEEKLEEDVKQVGGDETDAVEVVAEEKETNGHAPEETEVEESDFEEDDKDAYVDASNGEDKKILGEASDDVKVVPESAPTAADAVKAEVEEEKGDKEEEEEVVVEDVEEEKDEPAKPAAKSEPESTPVKKAPLVAGPFAAAMNGDVDPLDAKAAALCMPGAPIASITEPARKVLRPGTSPTPGVTGSPNVSRPKSSSALPPVSLGTDPIPKESRIAKKANMFEKQDETVPMPSPGGPTAVSETPPKKEASPSKFTVKAPAMKRAGARAEDPSAPESISYGAREFSSSLGEDGRQRSAKQYWEKTEQTKIEEEKKKEEEMAMRTKVGRTSKIFEQMAESSVQAAPEPAA